MNKKISLIILILFSTFPASSKWKSYEKIIAVVNSVPIMESELNSRLNQAKKNNIISNLNSIPTKSQILDTLIEKALVYKTAEEKSIIISNKKVLLHLEKIMESFFQGKGLDPKIIPKITNRLDQKKNEPNEKLESYLKLFINHIEKTHYINFEDFFEELKSQFRKEQVMASSIGISPPKEKEILTWYKQNKNQIGYEVNFQQILIKPKKDSLIEEKKVYEQLSKIKKKISQGESFEEYAKKFSEDPISKKKGGKMGWVSLTNMDNYLANSLFLMRKTGSYKIIKTPLGYHLVKYFGRRPTPFKKLKDKISYKLYQENLEKKFQKWVQKKRARAEIKIYLKGYLKS
jgi:putative peptidyl-prolyl cis-trans isomerase